MLTILGNVGTLTGPPFFAALASYLNTTSAATSTANLAIQGVIYPADIPAFFLGGSLIGTYVLSSLINSTISRCPSTKMVVSGYSQGAQIVHNSLSSLPSNITDRISSVVLFGDPKNGTAIQGVASEKVMTFCHAGDDICKGGDVVAMAHLNYSQNAMEAAGFALGGMAELGITSMKMVRKGANGGLG
jgi:cutinase